MTMTESQIKRGYMQRFGRTNADLDRAEEAALGLAARSKGGKAYMVVEAFQLDETVGLIFVTDANGHEALANDDRFVTTVELSSYGVGE